MLELPWPARAGALTHSLTDLYLQSCGSFDAVRACNSDRCLGAECNHVWQRRLVHLPQLLLVKVARTPTEPARAYAFQVEDYVSFAGCDKAELVGVVYDWRRWSVDLCLQLL